MKLTHLILIGTLFLGACSQDYEKSLQIPETAAGVSENVSIIENYLSKTHKGLTRGENYTLIPWILEGDTTMYIANFPEGGFEIFSNTQALPMVLVKSKEGSFYPNEIVNPSPFYDYMKMASQNIRNTIETNTVVTESEKNQSWKIYDKTNTLSTEVSTRSGQRKQVGTAREIYTTGYTPKGGRTNTKWGQAYGFNLYVPFYLDLPNEHSLIGCSAVAVGQYVYFTNRRLGIPETMMSKGEYNPTMNTYSFSIPSSKIWDDIEYEDKNLKLGESRQNTSLLLGQVANDLCTKYKQISTADTTGSSTDSRDILEYMASIYDKGYYLKKFYFENVTDIFSTGYPVLMISQGTTNRPKTRDIGHAYLIDYAEIMKTTFYNVYAYIDKDPSSDDEDISYPGEDTDDYHPTLADYTEIYGEIEYSLMSSYTSNWVSMNWGWYGQYNNILINADIVTWDIDSASETLSFDKNYIVKDINGWL